MDIQFVLYEAAQTNSPLQIPKKRKTVAFRRLDHASHAGRSHAFAREKDCAEAGVQTCSAQHAPSLPGSFFSGISISPSRRLMRQYGNG
jgi:hypothetical protein